MAYQFVHVETYSVTDGAGVAAEAGRKPSHSRHIDAPLAPVLLAGVEPVDAFNEIARRHAAARDKVTVKGVERERRLRSDQNIMIAAVASYPTPTTELDQADPGFKDWQRRVMRFMEAEHGPALSAVLHLDESHPHIHYITAPDLEAGKRIHDVHRGLAAKQAAGGNRGRKSETDKAYNDAMRAYQDAYHDGVGRHHAQARLGPRSQRLDRSEWAARQAEAQRIAKGLSDGRAGTRLRKTAVARLKAVNEKGRALEERSRALSSRESRLERATGTLWGRIVSIVTLGRRSAAKQVERAVAERQAALDKYAQAARAAAATTARMQKRIDEERAVGQGAAGGLKRAQRDLAASELKERALSKELTRIQTALERANVCLAAGDTRGARQALVQRSLDRDHTL